MSAGFLLADGSEAWEGGAQIFKLICFIAIGAVLLLVLLLAVALFLTVFRYVLEHLDDLYAFIDGVGRRMWKHRGRIALFSVATLVVGGVGAAVWELQPRRHRERLAAAIARDDAAWQSEMDKITALIDAERPDKFDLSNEIVTADALRGYVERCLRLGEALVASMGRMRQTAHELDALLKEAPARYREMAELERRYEKEEKRTALKEKYRNLAEIWEAKAKAAELHRGDVQKTLNSDLEDYLKAENVFLDRLLAMLDQGLAVDDLRDVAQFTKALQDVVQGHEYLRKTLRAWRERMVKEPEAAPQREVESTETAAPK